MGWNRASTSANAKYDNIFNNCTDLLENMDRLALMQKHQSLTKQVDRKIERIMQTEQVSDQKETGILPLIQMRI